MCNALTTTVYISQRTFQFIKGNLFSSIAGPGFFMIFEIVVQPQKSRKTRRILLLISFKEFLREFRAIKNCLVSGAPAKME